MADIKVEKRAVPGWVPLAALLAVLAAALMAWGLWSNRPAEQVGLYDPARQASLVVPYEGRSWIPADVDQAVRFSDDEMLQVATVNGVALYANPDEGAGGGGGDTAIPQGLETQPYGRIYLRMADGRYLPMVWRSEVER